MCFAFSVKAFFISHCKNNRFALVFRYASKKILALGVLCLLISTCGRRTPPRPIPLGKEVSAFHSLSVKQRGNRIRLSWVMQRPFDPKSGLNRFVIEEMRLQPHCVDCPPPRRQIFIHPFPSDHFQISGQRIYYYPDTEKDLDSRAYTVTYETSDGEVLSDPQVIQFRSFSDFPGSFDLVWEWVRPEDIVPLREMGLVTLSDIEQSARLLKLSWNPISEKVEFELDQSQVMTQRTVFYRVNIYRRSLESEWSEIPIHSDPISDSFYIDSQPQTEHIFLYQIRLVDSQGNESSPSPTYTISAPQPSL